MDALSGNSSDKASFRQTLNAHLKQLQDGVGLSLIVADSACIRRKHCKTLAISHGSRAFRNDCGTRELILAASDEWLKIRPERAYTVLGSSYGALSSVGWWFTPKPHTVVPNKRSTSTSEAKPGRVQSLQCRSKRSLLVLRMPRQPWHTCKKTLKVVALHDPCIVEVEGFKGKGVPLKVATWYGQLSHWSRRRLGSRNTAPQDSQKSCFILASNQWRKRNLARRDTGLLYAGPTKSRTRLSFFERPLVYGEYPVSQVAEADYGTDDDHDSLSFNLWALEYRIRQTLQEQQQTFPHPTWNPTVKLLHAGVSIFRGYPCVVIDSCRELILNCNEYHYQLLNLLGERYIRLYAIPVNGCGMSDWTNVTTNTAAIGGNASLLVKDLR